MNYTEQIADNLIEAGLIPKEKRDETLVVINGQINSSPLPIKAVWVTEHCSCLIRYALVSRLKSARVEHDILKLTRTRDLTKEERWMLPANISQFSREDLMEQVDSWGSLVYQIEGWIEEFKVE